MDLSTFYKDKTILVTGGCGSIGSNLVRRLLEFDPRVIRVFDNNEAGLFELEQDLQSTKIRPLIGDLRSKRRERLLGPRYRRVKNVHGRTVPRAIR